MRTLASGLAGLVAVLVLVACGGQRDTPPDGRGEVTGLAAYPPMGNGHAPGASAAARATAAALGRGVNFGNMLEAPQEGDWGARVRPEYIDSAAAAGFRTIRLPVRWSNHASPGRPFTIDPAFLAHVDSLVDAMLARGMYVMLNMHHYRQLDGDALDAGETPVDPTLLDERFLALWSQIAPRFADKSDHLVLELYNEPHGRQTAAKWNDMAARALAVVRRSNPDRVVVIGPVGWNNANALDSLRLPDDANLIVTVHNYEPFSFTHQGAEWMNPILPVGVSCCDAAQQTALTDPLARAKAWSDAHGYPVYLGEFGAYGKADMDSRVRYTRLERDAAEARGISWAYWEFASGFGVYDPEAHAFRAPLRQALLGS
jgi:endoglucanase